MNSILPLIVFFILGFTRYDLNAQSTYSNGALKGLGVISEVLIEDLDPELKSDGLDEKFI